EGRLKLVDFGLAVRVAQRPSRGIGNSSEATTISAEIMPASPLAGTPGYIAPEVMRGSEPSTHSDQFAFGMTLHEMLTGRHPLEGMSWPQILMNEKIPVDRSLHRDLRRIVERCTAHDPEARYLDMQAVGEDLHAALRRREPRQRLLRRIILGLLGGLILVPVFMYGTHLVHVRQAVELNQQALLLAQQGQLTEAWNLLLQARILAPGEIKPCTNSASLMRLITPDPGAAIEMLKSCAANFPQSDTILYNLGALLARNGSPGEARQPLRTALTLARSDEIRTGALNELALVHMALGHPERGLKLLEERWPAGLRSPVQMSALEKTRGILLLEMDRPDEALRYLKAALADLPKVPKEQAPVRNRILIKTLQGMGRALEALGDLPGALKHYTMMIRSIDEGPAPPGRRQKIVSNMKRLNRLMETGQPAEPLP
ncbi:MAG: tetratricopeptide repeat protein, partial [Acidobacteriota bacterium]